VSSTEIDTGLNPLQPICWFQDRKQVLYGVNGIDRGVRWDGFAAATGLMGVTAPVTAPTITPDTGGAATAGDYVTAYRYVARDLEGDVFSSLSGLATTTMTANQEFNWSAMDAPTEDRVTHVQFWRTTVDETNVFYLIEEVAEGSLGSHVDQKSDATLLAQDEDERLVYEWGNGQANAMRFTPPPEDRPYAVIFQDRAFYFGSLRLRGTCTTDGTTTIAIAETYFPTTANIAGWQLSIEGEAITYVVQTVGGSTGAWTVVLDTAPASSTAGLDYTLYPLVSNHRQLEYSEVDEIESVPVANTITIQDNIGDDQHITAGRQWGSALYVFTPQSKYAITFVKQANIDSTIRLIDDRGAFNNNCVEAFEDAFYAMDNMGCYKYSMYQGGGNSMPISAAIQNEWRDGGIDFSASDNFFVEVDRTTAQVRFWVQFGDGVTDRCFVWNVRTKTWDHENYPAPGNNGIRCSTPAVLDQQSAISEKPRSILGGSNGRCFVREGTTDIVSQVESGTCEASSGTGCTITDASGWQGWGVRSFVGATLLFEETGQTAVIASYTQSTNKLIIVYTATISPVPAATATVKAGVVPWSWKSRKLSVVDENDTDASAVQNRRECQVGYEPFDGDIATLKLKLFQNYETTPVQFQRGADFISGITVSNDTLDNHADQAQYSDAINFDLSVDRFDSDIDANGFLNLDLSGRLYPLGEGLRYLTVELSGYQGDDRIVVNELNLIGFTK
jgi:hypothetical protein